MILSENKIAVVLLNWNGSSDTIACLESLMDLPEAGVGIFVCDNASSDDSVERIRAWANDGLRTANARRASLGKPAYRFHDLSTMPSDGHGAAGLADGAIDTIMLIQTGRNGGYAAGNNVGLRHALANGFDYFWILNNDTEVEPDALSWLVHRMSEDRRIGICGSTLIYAGRRDLVQCWGGAGFIPLKGRGIALGAHSHPSDPVDRDAVEARLRFVNGASMFVSRAFLQEIGLMPEDYFLYCEEIDWATRGRKLFRLGYAPRSVVYHKVGASIGTNDFGDLSPISDFYMARSQLKFCARFSKISLPFAIFDVSRNIFRWMKRRQWARAALLVRAAIGLSYVKPS